MKKLYIIRHAKSSWNFEMADHDRPLGVRGRRDVKIVAKHLSQNEPTPDLLITSTASRALHTALFIADEWGYPEDQIALSKKLFHASSEEILEVLAEHRADVIAIFGHNPGLTELINELQEDYLDNLPTCAVMAITFDADSWKAVSGTKGTKITYLTPKELKRR